MKNIYTFDNFVTESVQKPRVSNEIAISKKINNIIDYTVISPGVISDKVKESIDLSLVHNYYAVVVNPELVDFAVFEKEKNDIKIVSTLNFKNDLNNKNLLNETVKIISNGADEIDMLIDIKKFQKAFSNDDEEVKEATYRTIENGIKDISNECHKNSVILKVIVESGVLSMDELKDICEIVTNGNADYIQTSSGRNEIGAELKKVKYMRHILPDYVKIKAAGGIHSLKDANDLYPFVDRIGTSSILK